MSGTMRNDTPLAQSLVASVQLNLPGTVARLSSKMRFIDKVAPQLKEAGIVRNVPIIRNPTMRAAGIATAARAIPAFGGILYLSGAVRQDLFIDKGSIYKTTQESVSDLDEIDDLDFAQKIAFVNLINAYKLLDELMDTPDKPEIILMDVPLLLERSDVPQMERGEHYKLYQKVIKIIEGFWTKHQNKIFPFNPEGLRIASLRTGKFGAIVLALNSDSADYIADTLNDKALSLIKEEETMERIKSVGVKRLLQGILHNHSRTAAFQFEGISPQNRFEPESLRHLGLMGMHIKAGLNTPPMLVEFFGTAKTWDSTSLDTFASQIISLFTMDQPKALPLPLWYAKHSLKAISAKPGVLEYYKSQAKQMLNDEEIDNIWRADIDIFEE